MTSQRLLPPTYIVAPSLAHFYRIQNFHGRIPNVGKCFAFKTCCFILFSLRDAQIFISTLGICLRKSNAAATNRTKHSVLYMHFVVFLPDSPYYV